MEKNRLIKDTNRLGVTSVSKATAKDSQECCCFLGLKEHRVSSPLKVPHTGEISRGKWMVSTQIWIVIKQSTDLSLNEHPLGGNECEELTHLQQQQQARKTHKKKPTIRLTTRVTMLWTPQRFLVILPAYR